MRHQHRKGHRLQDAPRRSAQNKLAKAGVAVAAHHHQIGSGLEGIGEKCASDVACARQPLRLSMDPVSAQMVHDPEAKRLAVSIPSATMTTSTRLARTSKGIEALTARAAVALPSQATSTVPS